ncbi:class I SAM-dependent methyltransferase [bacterium]|nr:class I SAM-dependent methyltransferase [bacterium]
MRTFGLYPFKKRQINKPYHAIAGFYDDLMSHVNYRLWADYIEECFKKFGKNIHSVLDVGCGTGSMVLELKRRGFWAAGFDISLPMVYMARSKGMKRVWQGDLCQPAVKNWDALLCLYDTIHYIPKDKITQVFRQLFYSLRIHGILVFDIVTEHHVKQCWAGYTEKGRENGFYYTRQCWYNARKSCQHTEFNILIDNQKNIYYEHHKQWIYPVSFYIEQAEACGFEYYGHFDDFTFEPGNNHSERIHVVLCRRE